jgi:hypothetical protein
MQYRSAIRGVPRHRHRTDTEYWTLVHKLMEAGWYRIGQDHDPSRRAWGFRAGHTAACQAPGGTSGTRTAPRPDERWIVARSELSAMRRLLREL